ncbi:MAG: carboxypeptidase regulatory-like domain-containing protein [Deltaproteobacteria bacterium]|nr:carboxypeptidase regulatory-like domain-containing protein [Deltaproteobacteria bacterium]
MSLLPKTMRLTPAALGLLLCALTARDRPGELLRPGVVSARRVMASSPTARAREPGGAVRGRVTDESGHPVRGATLRWIAVREGLALPVVSVQTDESGRFEVQDLPLGSWWVQASAPGRARVVRPLRVRGPTQSMALTLGPAASIVGTTSALRGTTRSALGSVLLRATREGTTAAEDPGVATRSDAQGRFRLDGLSPGTWRIELAADGFEALQRIGVAAPTVELSLTLRALATLSLTVLDGAGNPAAGASVVVSGSGIWPPRSLSTNDLGAVALPSLPGGVYEVRATRGTSVAEPVAPLWIEPGETRAVTAVLGEGRTLAGVVTDAVSGRPLVGARVALTEDGISTAPRATATAEDGRFGFEGLLARTHTLWVRLPGYAPIESLPVVPGGESLAVRLDPAASIDGTVIDARGRAVANAQVEVVVRDLDNRPRWVSAASTGFQDALFNAQSGRGAALLPRGDLGVLAGRVPIVPVIPGSVAAAVETAGFRTDAAGHFRVTDLPPGSAVVSVSHPGYARAVTDPLVLVASRATAHEVVLHPGGAIHGRAVNDRRLPISGVEIELRTPTDPMPQRALTTLDGTFHFIGIYGPASLTAWSGGRVVARVEARVDDGAVVPMELVLAGSLRRVEGRVVDERGFPVGGAMVTVASLDPGSAGAGTGSAAPDGTFAVSVGGRGGVSVAARHPDFAPREIRLAQVSQPLRIELTRGTSLRATVRDDGCATEAPRGGVESACGPVTFALRDSRDLAIDHLCDGRATLRLSAPGCVPVERELRVAGATIDLGSIELRAGGSVSGEVLDERGDPVVGASVRVSSSSPGDESPPSITDRSGRFVLPTVPEGTRTLVAEHRGRLRSEPQDVRVLRGTEVRGVRLRLSQQAASPSTPSATIELARVPGGFLVGRVSADSAEARAGIQTGDVIASIDGREPRDAADAVARLQGVSGSVVIVDVERDGQRRVVRLSAIERR